MNSSFKRLYVWLLRWVPEFSAMLALLAIVGGIWGFAELADEVRELDAPTVDQKVLLAMRSAEDPHDAWGPQWVETAALDLTAMGSYAPMFVVVAAVVGYLLLKRLWGNAILITVAVFGGLGMNHLFKGWFSRARPDVVPHLTEVHTLSFPSGHAMMSAVVYLTLGALLAQASDRRRLKIYVMALAVTLTLLIGVTRVYLGVHYPTDVLAGWSLGLAWAALAWLAGWVTRQLTHVRQLEHKIEPGAE